MNTKKQKHNWMEIRDSVFGMVSAYHIGNRKVAPKRQTDKYIKDLVNQGWKKENLSVHIIIENDN